tara:strand:+ start:8192 stop:8794 length:603 start_codon:yes stop_codon:yes gene_type:complete
MVKTYSNSVALGSTLPTFNLFNTNSPTNENYSFSDLDERHLFIMFICAHCPFVKYVEPEISRICNEINNKFQVIAISSNDITTHPADSPENLKMQAKNNGWLFPYLYDENQSFAKKLEAACTPDFYLYSNLGNKNFSLYYHGQLDSSRPSNDIPLTGKDLRSAIKALVKDQVYSSPQLPSLGCNIKWSPGKEPKWFKSIK